MLRLAKIYLLLFFVAFTLKWYLRGLLGNVAAQLVLLSPMILFSYTSAMTSSNKNIKFQLTSTGKYHLTLFLLFCLLISIAFFRAVGIADNLTLYNMTGRFITFLTTLLFSYFIFRVCFYQESFNSVWIWQFVTIGLIVYVLANISGAALGIENPFHETLDVITDDAMFSFWDHRIVFPFTCTPWGFAVELGVLATLLITFVPNLDTRYKVLAIFLLFVVLAAINACNSRWPLIALFIVIVNRFLGVNLRVKYQLFLLGLILVAPLVFTLVDMEPYLNSLPVDLSFLSRKQDLSTIATLNNRTMIWEVAFDELRDFKMIHLVGYGAFGHVVTEMSYQYGGMWKDPSLITLHNTYLQYLIDFGYIGLFVFIMLIINLILGFNRNKFGKNITPPHASLNVLLYLLTMSLAGSVIYPSSNMIIFIFILINLEFMRQQTVSVSILK